jgi:hypothetical protein
VKQLKLQLHARRTFVLIVYLFKFLVMVAVLSAAYAGIFGKYELASSMLAPLLTVLGSL